MKDITKPEDDFNSSTLFQVIYKWRKPLGFIVISAMVISSLIALFIKDKYKSTVILFPATINSPSKALLAKDNTHFDILQFGGEEAAEQMLQILNSKEIQTRICEKYDLLEHYDIDPDSKQKNANLENEFKSNVSFKRTEYMSVKIEVLDIDAKIAANIANDIAALYDSVKIRIQGERAKEALKIVEREYFEQLKLVNEMTDSMKVINSHGVYDFESQSERTIQQYNIELTKGNQQAIKTLKEQLDILSTYGSAYILVRENLNHLRRHLNVLKKRYEELKVDTEQALPQKFVVSRAVPAEKKSYPIRWVIVVVSMLSTLLISILGILVIEKIQRWEPA